MADHSVNSECGCKVGRATDAYDLPGLNEAVRARYRDDGASLRDLASFINRQILEAALEDAPDGAFDSTRELFGALERDEAVASIHRALTTDGVSPDRQARVRTRLVQHGIDPDAITDDWVSHTTVRSHLRDCLEIDTGSTSELDLDDAMNTLEWARARCAGVVERVLQRLQASNTVQIASPDVTVSIRVTCTACHTSCRPSELADGTSCDCEAPGSPDDATDTA